ncbi:MAG: hypothetical protein IJG36_11825 [Synergistaceae bacterium]|nr:hypothetical protein [Synergistaceae bacterium]
MCIFLATLAILLGFCYLGALTIFFADDITDWLEAKADYLRTKAEAIRQEAALNDESSNKDDS